MSSDESGRIETFVSYVPRTVLSDIHAAGASAASPRSRRTPAALLLIDVAGFTAITAAAVERGTAGTEGLSRSLNEYLGQVIDLIAAHGGDVVKIVGDGLIAMWSTDEDLVTLTTRAAVCGLAVARELDEFDLDEGGRLSLKAGLCAGSARLMHVGGLDGKWLFLIAGDAASQLPEVGANMESGTLVASRDAWQLIAHQFVGDPTNDGHVRVRSTRTELMRLPIQPPELGSGALALLRGYIPDVTLARLDAGQAAWLAELRRTTVVFANIRGVDSASPDVTELLHVVTLAAQRALSRYQGWLKEITIDDKGTTLVAAFGVPPFTHEDDSARALEAASVLVDELEQLGLSAGAGVASGQALCGPVGNDTRRDFAVLGQHVNLAARLMTAAEHREVFSDGGTYAASRSAMPFERLPPHFLRGMSSPIEVYRRVSDTTTADRPPDLVDRGRELEAASAVLGEDGGMVVLEGEPGIGKTRLVRELVRRARAREMRTVVGPAAEIESSTPYHAWRIVLERLFGLETVTDRSIRRDVVLARLDSDEDKIRMAPLLAPVLSLDLDDNEVTSQLSGAVRADHTRDLLVSLLRLESAKGSLMVIIEDAHWLDSPSWTLLQRIRRDVPSLAVVLTMRPVGDVTPGPLAELRDGSATLRLQPLARDDVVALACQRTGARSIDDSVAAVVHARAEGNPLFIEQLTYAMRDTGRIVLDDAKRLIASAGESLDSSIIPATVQRVITSRMDQLPPGEALTLKVASVIGQQFSLMTLRDIYPIDIESEQLEEHLVALSQRDLVTRIPRAREPTFTFRHVITQEVAYNLMLSEQSRELHRRLAEWHEQTYASDLTPFHAFLAHHWRRAGEPRRAVDHLELAASQALQTFANREAIDFLQQAIAVDTESTVGTDAGRRARWHLQLGEAHVNLSHYREGRHHLELGLALLRRPAPSSAFQQGRWLVGEVLRQGVRRAGLLRGKRHLTDAERNELVIVCRAYERLAEVAYYGQETMLPLYCVIRILNEAEASQSPAEIARGFAGSGALLGVVPVPRLARWYLDRAFERLEEVDDLTTHEIVEVVIGFHAIGAGQWEIARTRFESVRRIARRLGDWRRFDDAVANLMELEYLQGNFQKAQRLAHELVASAGTRNDTRFRAEAVAGLAYTSWLLGDASAALESLTELRAVVTDDPDITDDIRIKYLGISGTVHLSRGDSGQALAAAADAMRLTAGRRPTYFGTFLGLAGPAEVYLGLWEASHPSGDVRSMAAEALDRLRAFARVFPIGQPRALLLQGRHAVLRGRSNDALRLWRRALVRAEELGMTLERGLAHSEIAHHLDVNDPERAFHAESAERVLAGIEAFRPRTPPSRG